MEYTQFKLTDFQRTNLDTLASFLERHIPPPEFDMSRFIRITNKTPYWADAFEPYECDAAKYEQCGTVACAVGHGPLAGIPAIPGEGWIMYASRCFIGSVTEEDNGFEGEYNRLFKYLFGEKWASFDNTPQGAAARIRYFLDKGLPENSTDYEVADYQQYLLTETA